MLYSAIRRPFLNLSPGHPGSSEPRAGALEGRAVIRRRIVLAILLVVLFALGWWAGRVASRDLYADLDLFVEVLHKVEANYVDPVEPRTLIDGAIKGMLRQLDPHSQYLDEKAYANLLQHDRGHLRRHRRRGERARRLPHRHRPDRGHARLGGRAALGRRASSQSTASPPTGWRSRTSPTGCAAPTGTQVRVKVSREGEDEDHEVDAVAPHHRAEGRARTPSWPSAASATCG